MRALLILILAVVCPMFAADRAKLIAQYNTLPLSFEENRGQADAQVKFLARGHGYALLLGRREVALRLGRDTVRMKFVGAGMAPQVTGMDLQPGTVNYLIGNDPRGWRRDVRTYARVEYRGLYPGINLVYYGNQRQLEYDLVVAPQADPRAIRLAFDGIQSLRIDDSGDLILQAEGGEIRQSSPRVYQEVGGARKELAGRYVMAGRREVAFQVDGYDRRQPLIIDPVLGYATYLGGGGDDDIWGIAVDSSGNAYVAGETRAATTAASDAFPITTGVKAPGGVWDGFVTKFSADGKSLVYSTYLGGNNDDGCYAIAVDSAGNAYVTGYTLSTNFPTTNGYQTTNGGGSDYGDAFVTKLDSTGKTILYSTYFGGEKDESGNAIALDSSGNVYVTGGTLSTSFPKTSGAFQSAVKGDRDVFVVKLNPALTGTASLLYSTYLGGTNTDRGYGIAVDSTGNIYVTGETNSTDFPTTKSYRTTITNAGCTTSSLPAAPCYDAFVAKLNPAAAGTASLVYSTYLGGTADQSGYAIAVDSTGSAVVGGDTYSTNFPVTSGAFQTTVVGGTCAGQPCYDGFVTKLKADGTDLVYSTYLGGKGDDSVFGVALDSSGNIYAAGWTSSPDFPTSAGVLEGSAGGYDAFVTKLNPSAAGKAALVSSTYLGGSGDDWANGIAVDASGKAYVAGVASDSLNFPVTSGTYKRVFGTCDNPLGCDRSFVATMTFSPEVTAGPRVYLNGFVSAATTSAAPASPGDIVVIYGSGIGPATLTTAQLDSTGKVATTLAQTRILFDGIAAPLVYVSANQSAAVIPFDVAGKQVSEMHVEYQGASSNTLVLPVFPSDLGIFSANLTGVGQGAILNQDSSANSASNAAARGSVIQVYLTGAGQLSPAGVNGQLAAAPYPKIAATVTATIGGLPATVQYSGAAPGGVAGFMQVNLLVPATAPTGGAVPIQINLGSPAFDSTQDGITVAIK